MDSRLLPYSGSGRTPETAGEGARCVPACSKRHRVVERFVRRFDWSACDRVFVVPSVVRQAPDLSLLMTGVTIIRS
jgi:hypothetical protein